MDVKGKKVTLYSGLLGWAVKEDAYAISTVYTPRQFKNATVPQDQRDQFAAQCNELKEAFRTMLSEVEYKNFMNGAGK